MANFKTHLSVAAACSGILATGFLEARIATPGEVWLYFAMGTLGGILPDIDANHSIPGRMLFSFFALVMAFLVLFSRTGLYSIAELALLWMGTYLIVRHVIFQLFARFSMHRGVFHSFLAAAFFGCLTTSLSYQVFRLKPLAAWTTGLFVSTGYIVHLLLDELYSVDLTGARVKRSFGTALKLMSHHIRPTSLLVGATLIAFYLTPSAETFVHTVFNFTTYERIKEHMLPTGGWFMFSR
ncbi:MAG: metal-dependent hydrolase [Candidatus Tectomicrobia bacterium]|uniref:Metal-dependent hydrolase n=1 Tax=Tectimicrobiota bacterium TaxID=2528274 RepID=A0A937W388_UNCTE|nr:metal-dependent hydrolase [Candidatus Tectomicrobia bacterium]